MAILCHPMRRTPHFQSFFLNNSNKCAPQSTLHIQMHSLRPCASLDRPEDRKQFVVLFLHSSTKCRGASTGLSTLFLIISIIIRHELSTKHLPSPRKFTLRLQSVRCCA